MLGFDSAKGMTMVNPQTSRNALLTEAPRSVGSQWALDWCRELHRDGRAVEGGWPGTLPEARTRILVYFHVELPRRGMLTLSATELVEATRATYNAARQRWLEAQQVAQRRSRRKAKR